MDKLPVELLEKIFDQSCIDDGSTGAALSAVSRSVRAATARWRFHAVSLRGPKQVKAFVALLESTSQPLPAPKRGKPTLRLSTPIVDVRHLFLAESATVRHGQETLSWCSPDSAKPTSGSKLRNLVDRIRRKPADVPIATPTPEEEFLKNITMSQATVRMLLFKLAPTLETLHLDGCTPLWLVSLSLPHLTELTCHYRPGLYQYMQHVNPFYHPELQFSQTLPALQRLHLIADPFQMHSPVRFILHLPAGLTHLRLSKAVDVAWMFTYMNRKAHTDADLLPPGMQITVASVKTHVADPDFDLIVDAARSGSGSVAERMSYVQDPMPLSGTKLFRNWLLRLHGEEGSWVKGTPLETCE
jgi:hypothetical protein